MISQIWSTEAPIAQTAVACDGCYRQGPPSLRGLGEDALLEAHLLASEEGFRLVRTERPGLFTACLCPACGVLWDKRPSAPRKRRKSAQART